MFSRLCARRTNLDLIESMLTGVPSFLLALGNRH
jgi:hypothetical protein